MYTIVCLLMVSKSTLKLCFPLSHSSCAQVYACILLIFFFLFITYQKLLIFYEPERDVWCFSFHHFSIPTRDGFLSSSQFINDVQSFNFELSRFSSCSLANSHATWYAKDSPEPLYSGLCIGTIFLISTGWKSSPYHCRIAGHALNTGQS